MAFESWIHLNLLSLNYLLFVYNKVKKILPSCHPLPIYHFSPSIDLHLLYFPFHTQQNPLFFIVYLSQALHLTLNFNLSDRLYIISGIYFEFLSGYVLLLFLVHVSFLFSSLVSSAYIHATFFILLGFFLSTWCNCNLSILFYRISHPSWTFFFIRI